MGLRSAQEHFTLERAASIERYRRRLNGAMADLFDEADFVFCSTHPDVAFKAEVRRPRRYLAATSSTRSVSPAPS